MSAEPERWIALVDCESFFASCERVFDPTLAHATLIEKIADEGCVISEAAPGSAPTRWRFLQRNRLIAALSHATLITEAGRNSGSLNLAGHAERFGKPVGAVPGPITSATSAGCHRLIKDHGATLITSGTDTLTLIDAAR